jgi:hypothetical protein
VTRHGAAEAASRFPGFDPLDQVPHWDQVTADLIEARVRAARPVTFFTEAERACAAALLEDLTRPAHEPRVPVAQMVEARLAAGETDGWRYEDLPEDGQAWQTRWPASTPTRRPAAAPPSPKPARPTAAT